MKLSDAETTLIPPCYSAMLERDKKLLYLHRQEQQQRYNHSASEGINNLRNTPPTLSTLQENVRAIRAVHHLKALTSIPWHVTSPLIIQIL